MSAAYENPFVTQFYSYFKGAGKGLRGKANFVVSDVPKQPKKGKEKGESWRGVGALVWVWGPDNVGCPVLAIKNSWHSANWSGTKTATVTSWSSSSCL